MRANLAVAGWTVSQKLPRLYSLEMKSLRLVLVMVLVPLLVAALFNGAYWLVSTLMERLH